MHSACSSTGCARCAFERSVRKGGGAAFAAAFWSLTLHYRRPGGGVGCGASVAETLHMAASAAVDDARQQQREPLPQDDYDGLNSRVIHVHVCVKLLRHFGFYL